MRGLLALLAFLAVLAPAQAHFSPNSEIALDYAGDAVTAEVRIPLGEIDYAMGAAQPRDAAALARWAATGARIVTPDDKPWRIASSSARIDRANGPPDLVATWRLIPPPGASTRRFTLGWSAVIDRVPNHVVLVHARADFRGGTLRSEPALLGALQQSQPRLAVDRGEGSAWRGFAASFVSGTKHIAEGHDHLLFLATLLLPAPLLARGRRWNGPAGTRATLGHLFWIVTAFTIGHSLTLVAGAFLGWQLPAQPVEVAIALSILISAIHAWRPLFAGREPVIAGLFGLVHGLAFATIIADFGLEPGAKALAILGFNLGIEAIQILVVLATVPALLMLAATTHYHALRIAGALLAGVAASAWAVERIAGRDNVIARTIDPALGYAPWLVGALTLLAFLLWRREKKSAAVIPVTSQTLRPR